MDLRKIILHALLFALFVPGVLVTLPTASSNKYLILGVHAVLFSVLSHYVWKNVVSKL